LCKIKNTGGLENQDKAKRDQRIESTGQQSADQDFQEKKQFTHNLAPEPGSMPAA
jgi:hypothetical protein